MLTYDLTARGRKTMYEYLYEAMKADILSGRLTAGEKLPSKRADLALRRLGWSSRSSVFITLVVTTLTPMKTKINVEAAMENSS